MAAGVIPTSEVENASVVHHYIQYEVRLVLRKELEDCTCPELKEGFSEVPRLAGADCDVDEEERARWLPLGAVTYGRYTETHSVNEMKKQLEERNLVRKHLLYEAYVSAFEDRYHRVLAYRLSVHISCMYN